MNDDLLIHSREGNLGLRLDRRTGLASAIILREGNGEGVELPLALTATLVTGGREIFVPPSNLGYVDVCEHADFRCVDPVPRYRTSGPEEAYVLSSQVGDWIVDWEYTFRQHHPRLELNVELHLAAGASPATLRNLRLAFHLHHTDPGSCLVEAPGNQLRPGVTADELQETVSVAPLGGTRGSTGLVALHQPGRPWTLVLWPFCRTELGDVRLHNDGGHFRLDVDTGLAGRLSSTERLRYGTVELDLLGRAWEEVRDDVPGWYGTLGLSTPRDRPEWVEQASIFEVQIGFSVFWGDYRYAPYPTTQDLLADLGRISGLGYDVLQIMPRQPYPSYNVHDFDDITASYGDENDLRRVVEACHALGMRVILDILMHGVIDKEVVSRTAARVRSGPYHARLAEDTTEAWGAGSAGLDAMNVAWSRHILDFEPYWLAESPTRHPLPDEHPEWFMHDSEGDIIGVYTKAFDVANVEWQEYFCAVAERLVHRLDIDGFRFDAPTYNALPNWSAETQHRASYSPLGALQLFHRLRPRLKRIKPSVMLYTEPSGVAFRQAMDVTYNYDEQWLIPAVLGAGGAQETDERSSPTSVRNGRELAAWFRERNAVLPPGSLTCHHVDSHDTFWWPLPGQKWRREQYGIAATRALLAVFALSGGAYMTFVGGGEGIDDEVRRVHRLRATLPELRRGTVDYTAVTTDHDAIYCLARRGGADSSLLLVNLSRHRIEAVCCVAETLINGASGWTVFDAWNDQPVHVSRDQCSSEGLRLPISFEAYQPRLLVVRSAENRGNVNDA